MAQFDLVIRNGTLADGTGGPLQETDVGVTAGKIAALGKGLGPGAEEIDAKGLLVTPGFVDIHTHYDAQATWDPWLTPSTQHGVTSLVMGNCGVGFAPAAPAMRNELIELMEAVEDIPGAAMHEGITWEWESFPGYLDALDRRQFAADVGTQVPHCALRVFVMGKRGIDNEPATPADIARMRELTLEGLRAGALGFSTSRTDLHNTLAGEPVPGTMAALDELKGIAGAITEHGHGVFQIAATHRHMDQEFAWMRDLARESGAMVTFNLQQIDQRPDLYREMLAKLDQAAAEGITNLRGQHSGRPVGLMMSWHGSIHPFIGFPEFRPLAGLSPAERYARLQDPAVRASLIAGRNHDKIGGFGQFITTSFHKMYPMAEREDYEPAPEDSLAARAGIMGKSALELAYDALMANGGQGLIYFPLFGFSTNDFTAIETCLKHPLAGLSLADGGAHVGAICDGSTPTFMLTHWARDRRRGPKMPVEQIVAIQTRDTARQYGLTDRGIIAVGKKADLNVIDFSRLKLTKPEMRYDLPAGGRRLWQGAEGYVATILSGQIVARDDKPTGALPGRLIRGRT